MGRFIASMMLGMALAASGAAERDVVLDAALADSSGEEFRLKSLWGKPTILFYEDKNSTGLNQALKDELFARGKREGLMDAASVVAVANLAGFNWFPAKKFAQAGVRDAEKEAGVPVLIDWQGTLSRSPWNLPSKTSSVLVLDGRGRVVHEAVGRLDADDRAEVVAVLRRLISKAGAR